MCTCIRSGVCVAGVADDDRQARHASESPHFNLESSSNAREQHDVAMVAFSSTLTQRRPLLLALLSMLALGSVLLPRAAAFVPPTRQPSAAGAGARPAPRWASKGPGGAEEERTSSGLPEGFPTDRPLTSVEKRRIERATKTDSARKLSKNQRILDDFIGKRMGQGTAFYGCVL